MYFIKIIILYVWYLYKYLVIWLKGVKYCLKIKIKKEKRKKDVKKSYDELVIVKIFK